MEHYDQSSPRVVLPSEFKYSSSLVCGLSVVHFVLGAVMLTMGAVGTVSGSDINSSGAGYWSGIAALLSSSAGLAASKLWYKNWAIKSFLLASFSSALVCFIGLIVTLFALLRRMEQDRLYQQASRITKVVLYDSSSEVYIPSISLNFIIGAILEILLSFWSLKIAWKGVLSAEFSRQNYEEALHARLGEIKTNNKNKSIPLSDVYKFLQGMDPEILSQVRLDPTKKGNQTFLDNWSFYSASHNRRFAEFPENSYSQTLNRSSSEPSGLSRISALEDKQIYCSTKSVPSSTLSTPSKKNVRTVSKMAL